MIFRYLLQIFNIIIVNCIIINIYLDIQTVSNLLWLLPYLIINSIVMIFMCISLFIKPKDVNISPAVFLLVLIISNSSIFTTYLFGLFPNPNRNIFLITLGSILNLAILPFYLTGVLTLGKRLTVLPEANSLQTHGIYSISRHPLYLTYVYWFIVQTLILQTIPIFIFSLLQICMIIARANLEEAILQKNFPEYQEYKKEVYWLGRRSLFLQLLNK